jgi:hypothetical protein
MFDACVFLVWVTLYLASAYWIGRYRRAKLGILAGPGALRYRADKDLVLRLGVFAVGLILLVIVYLGTRAMTHFP